mgnify:CR=1 FL=1|jgi:hypothetical protein
MAWVIAHWPDIAFHLGLDLSGGFTLKCAMGMCKHKHHQYIVWVIGALIVSIGTVMIVG